MARDKGHLTDLQLRHWIKAGKPQAKADGDGPGLMPRRLWAPAPAQDAGATMRHAHACPS